jgi:hypothetical protein
MFQQHVLAHPRRIAEQVQKVKDALPLSFKRGVSGLHGRAEWVQEAIAVEGSSACGNVHRLYIDRRNIVYSNRRGDSACGEQC